MVCRWEGSGLRWGSWRWAGCWGERRTGGPGWGRGWAALGSGVGRAGRRPWWGWGSCSCAAVVGWTEWMLVVVSKMHLFYYYVCLFVVSQLLNRIRSYWINLKIPLLILLKILLNKFENTSTHSSQDLMEILGTILQSKLKFSFILLMISFFYNIFL